MQEIGIIATNEDIRTVVSTEVVDRLVKRSLTLTEVAFFDVNNNIFMQEIGIIATNGDIHTAVTK